VILNFLIWQWCSGRSQQRRFVLRLICSWRPLPVSYIQLSGESPAAVTDWGRRAAMPVERRYLEDFGLNHVCATEPFVPDDLYRRAVEDIENDAPPSILSAPMVLDLRQVDLLRFKLEDFRRLIQRRQALKGKVPGGPCAFLAGSTGSYGMLRMYTILGELSGLRKEEMTIVTTDVAEAVRWIFPRLSGPKHDQNALLSALK
jgi:hypothetical protein